MKKRRFILLLVSAAVMTFDYEEIKVSSFENPSIWIYKNVDADAIRKDIYSTTLDYLGQL